MLVRKSNAVKQRCGVKQIHNQLIKCSCSPGKIREFRKWERMCGNPVSKVSKSVIFRLSLISSIKAASVMHISSYTVYSVSFFPYKMKRQNTWFVNIPKRHVVQEQPEVRVRGGVNIHTHFSKTLILNPSKSQQDLQNQDRTSFYCSRQKNKTTSIYFWKHIDINP